MNALILMAHGSRNEKANQEVLDLARQLQEKIDSQSVAPAFLEIAKPSLSESIDTLIAQGADSIDVLPLFLNSGNHVASDIPEMVKAAQKKYPNHTIRLLRHIGSNSRFQELIFSIAQHVDQREPAN